jgi:xanthine/uracil/vitamin C permease (AzgA family)
VYAVRTLPAARGDRCFALLSAAFAGALGLASQALWLAADHPRPNWTLPRPHRFTAAGWYHAAFVVAMCAVTAALLALALNRVTLATHPPREVVAATAAGIACGVAFIALLAVDTHTTPGGAGLAGLLLALVALIAVGGAVTARRVARR